MLDDDLKALAKVRKEFEEAKAEVKHLEEQLYNNPEYQAAKDRMDSLNIALYSLDQQIRTTAVQEYLDSGKINKTINPFVKIRETKVMGVSDPDAVRQWCYAKAPVFLTVDWKAFEKFAKDSKDLPAEITFETKYQATIASNLDA